MPILARPPVARTFPDFVQTTRREKGKREHPGTRLLQPHTIAVKPARGWLGANINHLVKALQWLYYQEQQIPKQGASADWIQHVCNGGEQSVRTAVASYFIDGYDAFTRAVYKFHGCLYHGCPTCYPMRDIKHSATPDRTMEELYQATLNKCMALLRAGYTVIEVCQWDRLVENEPSFSQFLRSFNLVPPLKPREAFLGGQTGAVALHAVAGEGEEILYVDVTSLYPWINKNCLYPIGHPQILTQPVDQSLGSYFGMATVDILSPASLFHPVLSVCVVPVSRKSRPNPCCNALTNAITETSIGCYAVLGAPRSWSKQWKKITAYSKYMKYGIFPKPNVGQVSLRIMSIPG